MLTRLSRRKAGLYAPGPVGMIASYIVLCAWAFVVLFPLFWLFVTSFKTPIEVDSGPFYIPFVDFKPTLDAWQYILVGDLANDTRRNYMNTVVVALSSSTLAIILGAMAAYALDRFVYGRRFGMIISALATILLLVVFLGVGVPLLVTIAVAIAIFVLLFVNLARGSDAIAFWMIAQRMLPPVAVVIPIYVMFQKLSLLDTWPALIVTYVAANLPIVVWLMRDYFQSIPRELEECAAIDGASRYRTFWSIVLPLAVPGLVATFLFVLVFAWNEYLLALFLTTAKAQTLPLTIAAQNATRGPQWWYMSVLILIMIIPVIAMAIMLERYMAKGLLVGAVKG
jgi:multiple sugar transport system permease protein